MIEKLKAVSSLLKLLTSSLRHVSLLFRFLLQTLVTKETLRHAYIVFPSFQMSPDNTISLNTEDSQSFSGSAQKDYCGANGENVYNISIRG